MSWLFHLAGCLAALLSVVGAFVYLFNPREATNLFKKIGIALMVSLLLPVVVLRLISNADSVDLLIALVIVSTTAYFIRKRRLRRPEHPRGLGRAERTPVLPRREDES
jgi:hypothetical protein